MVWKPKESDGVKESIDGGKGLALGIVFRNIRFDEMLEKLLGIQNIPLAWLSEMTAGNIKYVKKSIMMQYYIDLIFG